MSLLSLPVYLIVGCVEWWISLRRTLACARGEKAVLVTIVFIENILGLWVLSMFIEKHDWLIAVSYSIGGALGAYLVSFNQSEDRSTRRNRSAAKEKRNAADASQELLTS